MKAIRNQVEQLNTGISTPIDYSKLSFSTDEEVDVIDSLEKQERRLSDFINSLGINDSETNILDELDRRIEENPTINQNFERIFRSKLWPIQMIGN